MTPQALIHLVPTPSRPDVWCFSVYYGGTLGQIRLHGDFRDQGSMRLRMAAELERLAKQLLALAERPSAIGWEHPPALRAEP